MHILKISKIVSESKRMLRKGNNDDFIEVCNFIGIGTHFLEICGLLRAIFNIRELRQAKLK